MEWYTPSTLPGADHCGSSILTLLDKTGILFFETGGNKEVVNNGKIG